MQFSQEDKKLNAEKQHQSIKESETGRLKPEPGRVEVERDIERKTEQEDVTKKEKDRSLQDTKETTTAVPQPTPSVPVTPSKTAVRQQVENILEEDLQEIYQRMDDKSKKRFKNEGEKTASKIEILLIGTRVKVNSIFKLIKKWLRVIPGVNKYFLEQEAKIKTDKLILIKKDQDQE
ncbi:DUF2057 domain-containing protein [Patescibacteria group bacterium]|nr:DUF2057 domain-containing protein [Patescibacteria group bacterium]MBU1889950.1 DUF2057 domain-containing protein [Patescibacteria group bacterium]